MSNEQKVTSNKLKVTSNKQKLTSNEQKVTGNKQKLTSNEQKVTSNEQRAKSFISKTRRNRFLGKNEALRNFKVFFYQNVRELKSKEDSLMETISNYQPMLIRLVETHLQKEEEIRIPGYSQIFRNNRSGNSGGIMLAVKENIRTVTLEVAQEKETGQSLWILLDNNRSKIRIGVIYAHKKM